MRLFYGNTVEWLNIALRLAQVVCRRLFEVAVFYDRRD